MSQVLINIRNIRVSKGFSQEYVASRIHISQSSYTRFESGRSKTLYEIIEKVAAFFDMPISDLINYHMHPRYPIAPDENTLAEEGENYQKLSDELANLRQRISINSTQIESVSQQLKILLASKHKPEKGRN